MKKYSKIRIPKPKIECPPIHNPQSAKAYSKPRNPDSTVQRGFTLIETIIVIVLAGLFIAVIVVPFTTGIRQSTKPEMVATAMYLAHQQMETFLEYAYCNTTLTPNTTNLAPTALTGYANITGFTGYQWEWSIYYSDNNFQNQDLVTDRGYKVIRVLVKDPMLSIYEVDAVVTRF